MAEADGVPGTGKPCAVDGCSEPRWVLKTGQVRARCHAHALDLMRKSQLANARKPCGVDGCPEPRHQTAGATVSFCHAHYLESMRTSKRHTAAKPCTFTGCREPRQTGQARCVEHFRQQRRAGGPCPTPGCTEPRWDAVRSSYCHHHQLEANRASKQKTGYRADKAKQRRRREAPWTWVPLLPWPSLCGVCHLPIDSTIKHGRESQGGRKHPFGETIGHEPPVAWLMAHPEHDGPLVLRPEHWACNSAKRDKPDWETLGATDDSTTPSAMDARVGALGGELSEDAK